MNRMTSPTLRATESLMHSRRRRVPAVARMIGPAARPAARPYQRASTATEQYRPARREQPATRPQGAEDCASGPSPILVAGPNSAQRAMLLEELTQTMPHSTVFEEASAFSEVLEHAHSSRMVILSGDLADIPA